MAALHHIDRVIASIVLAQNVADARRFNHGTHRAAGDNAGAGSRWLQHDAAGAKLVSTRCGMLVPDMGTRIRFFLACSTPLRIASGTSPALPIPAPTSPLPSPTTTMALKLKRRPPFTTFETRFTRTTRSSSLSPM